MTLGKVPPIPKTILGDRKEESLSDEERTRLAVEWAKRTLDQVSFMAILWLFSVFGNEERTLLIP